MNECANKLKYKNYFLKNAYNLVLYQINFNI